MVVSHKEANDHKGSQNMSLEFAPGSTKVLAVRKVTEVPMPATPEQLRQRYALMRVAWEVVRLRYPDYAFLQDYDGGVWERLVSYILGEKIYGYRSRNNIGLRWDDLLQYEFQIRKSALRDCTKNKTSLSKSLMKALKCNELHQEYFTLQLCTSGTRQGPGSGGGRAASSNANADEADDKKRRQLDNELNRAKKIRLQLEREAKQGGPPPPRPDERGGPAKGGGKAKGKGKGGHKTRALAQDLAEFRKNELYEKCLTGTNKLICLFYQTGSCVNGDDCTCAHVCLRCQQPGHTCLSGCRAPKRLR